MNNCQLTVLYVLGGAYFVVNLVGGSPLTNIVAVVFLIYLAWFTTTEFIKTFKELKDGDDD